MVFDVNGDPADTGSEDSCLASVQNSIMDGFEKMLDMLPGPNYIAVSITNAIKSINFKYKIAHDDEIIDTALEMLFDFGIVDNMPLTEQLLHLRAYFQDDDRYDNDMELFLSVMLELFPEILTQLEDMRLGDPEGLLNYRYCCRIGRTGVLIEKYPK